MKKQLFSPTLVLSILTMFLSFSALGQTLTYTMIWDQVDGSYDGVTFTDEKLTIKVTDVDPNDVEPWPILTTQSQILFDNSQVKITVGSIITDLPLDDIVSNRTAMTSSGSHINFGLQNGTRYSADLGSVAIPNSNTLSNSDRLTSTYTETGQTARTRTSFQNQGLTINGKLLLITDAQTTIGSWTVSGPIVPPSITTVKVPADGNYAVGDVFRFELTFDQAVTVSGTPRLPITVDKGGIVYAEYASGSGTNTLHFNYTIRPGLADSDGIVLWVSIDLNGGTIKDGSNVDADLMLNNKPSTSNIRIGGLFAYEPFSGSVNGATLTGKSGGTGLSGAWLTMPTLGTAGKVAITSRLSDNSNNFEYPANVNFAIDGTNSGKVAYNLDNSGWYPNANARELAYPVDLNADGVLYVSFLFRDQVATLPDVDGQAMMGFSTGVPSSTADSGPQAILFGYTYQDKMGLDVGPANLMAFRGATQNSYTALSATTFPGNPGGKSYFMVGRITTSTNGDTDFELKAFSPTDNVPFDESTITWDVTHTENLDGFDLTHLVVQLESKGLSELDEVRIGSNYFDVVGLTPSAPLNAAASFSGNDATISFSPPASGTTGLTGYVAVATAKDGSEILSNNGATSPITITGLDPAKEYTYKVAAINSAGIGAYATLPSITSFTPLIAGKGVTVIKTIKVVKR